VRAFIAMWSNIRIRLEVAAGEGSDAVGLCAASKQKLS